MFLLDGLGGLNFLGRPHFSWRSAFWPSACLVALIITTAPLCMIPYLQPHIIHISPKLSHRRSTHILLGRHFLISHHLIDFSIVLASETQTTAAFSKDDMATRRYLEVLEVLEVLTKRARMRQAGGLIVPGSSLTWR